MMNRFDEIPNSKDEFLQSLEMLLAPFLKPRERMPCHLPGILR